MVTTPTPARADRRLIRVPARRTIPGLLRDPLREFERLGRECDGALARLHLGLTRPYLATHPDHVQQILRRSEVYLRDGMMWRPIRRLEGDGIAAEGPQWRTSRKILQPLFTARSINALVPTMAAAVAEALDVLAERSADGRAVDMTTEMTTLMHRVLIRVFFGDRISFADAERLGAEIAIAFQSLGWRMLLPFVPDAVPLPGDRAFRRAVRTVDQLIYPLIRSCRAAGGTGDDLVALLANAVDDAGQPLDDKRVRDDVVSMFVAGTETTALALTWLWLLVDAHPEVAAKLSQEVAEVVGDDPPGPDHLPGLTYTRAVLQEALRLYPVGWVMPRTVREPDTIDGVPLRPGETVVLSPYLTHRLPAFWEAPDQFRPARFLTDARRHRFAYFPFGAGAHQCLGNHFFLAEGQLAVAGLLQRFRPEVVDGDLRPRATASLRPLTPPMLRLHPRR